MPNVGLVDEVARLHRVNRAHTVRRQAVSKYLLVRVPLIGKGHLSSLNAFMAGGAYPIAPSANPLRVVSLGGLLSWRR